MNFVCNFAKQTEQNAFSLANTKIQTIWFQTWPDSQMLYEKTIMEFQILIETYQN